MRIAITSTLGDPRDARTWSNAPAHLADALERRGVEIVAIDSGVLSRRDKYLLAARSAMRGLAPRAFAWDMPARVRRGRHVAAAARRASADLIVCCGTLDVPVGCDIPYAIWLDNSWNLLRRSAVALPLPSCTDAVIDAMERRALAGAAFVAPFSQHVLDDIVAHYAIPADRVAAIGCGAGPLPAFAGTKTFAHGHLLFVAKHQFASKGGDLALAAFARIRAARPQTELVVVGTDDNAARLAGVPGVRAYGFLPRAQLDALFHEAAMLVQPMLADPWGQVYIEAQKARAVVVALNVAAVPELTCDGTLGVIAADATPAAIADAVLATYARPQADLNAMTRDAQRHALATHDWDAVAARLLTAAARCATVAAPPTLG